ncbi:MAG TPA: hypothetical protein VFS08_07660 [Gemmatimonadaceae bacterium]|nr:hypothetical protein [Gemmatimonadaceae bacterium]
MRWRSEVIGVVSLAGAVASALAQPAVLLAQPAQVPGECACLLPPDKPHGPGVPNPGPPGVPEPPGTPGGTPDSVTSGSPRRTWVYLGAAGVALLAGIPFGGSGAQALPFAPSGDSRAPLGPSVMGMQPAPPAAARGPEIPVVSHGDVAPAPVGEARGAATPGTATAPAPASGPMLPAAVLGLVPPKTATHLPLLGALGVLLVGAGGLLGRRAARERRRRRRFVAI